MMEKIDPEIVSKLDQLIADPPEEIMQISLQTDGRASGISIDAAIIYNAVAVEYNKLDTKDDRRKFLKAIEVQIGIVAKD